MNSSVKFLQQFSLSGNGKYFADDYGGDTFYSCSSKAEDVDAECSIYGRNVVKDNIGGDIYIY